GARHGDIPAERIPGRRGPTPFRRKRVQRDDVQPGHPEHDNRRDRPRSAGDNLLRIRNAPRRLRKPGHDGASAPGRVPQIRLAAIRARGASGWQTAGLLIGEAASIMLIGLIVGTGIGVLAAYLSTSFIAAGPGSAGESLVPLLFVLPPEALLLLVLAPAAMLLTSFAVTIRVARMDIARGLKLRGG